MEIRISNLNWDFVHPRFNCNGTGHSASSFKLDIVSNAKKFNFFFVNWDSSFNLVIEDDMTVSASTDFSLWFNRLFSEIVAIFWTAWAYLGSKNHIF